MTEKRRRVNKKNRMTMRNKSRRTTSVILMARATLMIRKWDYNNNTEITMDDIIVLLQESRVNLKRWICNQ